MECRTNSAVQRLLIECPTSVKTALVAADADFETFSGVYCLRLMLMPDQYTPVKTYANGDPAYVRTLAYEQFALRAYSYAIELKIADERDTIYYAIQQIATLSSANPQFKQEVRVFDFVLPEVEGIITARSTTPATIPFTMRTGVITAPEAKAGRAIGEKGVGGIKGGFTFKFLDRSLRLR